MLLPPWGPHTTCGVLPAWEPRDHCSPVKLAHNRFPYRCPDPFIRSPYKYTNTKLAPRPPAGDSNRGGGRPGDPFGREALAFSRQKLMQRAVELRVTDMDKNGVALGFLYFGTGANKRSFAEDIVKVC